MPCHAVQMTAALQRLEVTYDEGKPAALAEALAAARAFPELQADCASAQQLLELLQPSRAAAAGMGPLPKGSPSSQAGTSATELASGSSSRGQGAGADSAVAAAAVLGAGDASGCSSARQSAMAAQDMPSLGRQEAVLPLDGHIRQAVAASTVWDSVGATSAPWQAVTAETGAGDGSHSAGTWDRVPNPPAAAALPAAAQLDAAALRVSAGRAGARWPRPSGPPGFFPAAGQSRGPQQPGSGAPGALPAATAGLQAAEQPWVPPALQRLPAVAGCHAAEQSWQAGAPSGGKHMLDVEGLVGSLWESREPAEPALGALQPVEVRPCNALWNGRSAGILIVEPAKPATKVLQPAKVRLCWGHQQNGTYIRL